MLSVAKCFVLHEQTAKIHDAFYIDYFYFLK